MEATAVIIANGGEFPEHLQPAEGKWLTRRNGVKIGAAWMAFGGAIAMLLAATGARQAPEVFAAIGAAGGFLIMFLSWLFLASGARSAKRADTTFASAQAATLNSVQPAALPPQQSIPAQDYIQPGNWKAPDTDQLIKQGSVTDSTTKLLKKDS